MSKQQTIIHIPIVTYRDIIQGKYIETKNIDIKLGLEYIPKSLREGHFSFNVVNKNRLLLAKIKYSI